MIEAFAKRYYVFRLPILFGESSNPRQFVEKMLQRLRNGQKVLRIAGDIFSSPTYSRDVAEKILQLLGDRPPYGLYHIANEGKGSLYELMREIVRHLDIDVTVEKTSYAEFPFKGIKNTNTPLKSEKINALRPWREAVEAYCRTMSLQ